MKTDPFVLLVLLMTILMIPGGGPKADCLWQQGTRDNWALFRSSMGGSTPGRQRQAAKASSRT